MKNTLITAGLATAAGAFMPSSLVAEESKQQAKPNILWIMTEDWSNDLSCYGTKGIHTPNVDKLASEGVRFTRGYCTSPVCSPSRSSMMTGFYQNYIGSGQHRTPRKDQKPLPNGIKPITHLLEETGYYTAILGHAKIDCNFTTDKPLFMGKDWKKRKPGQPFFAQVTFAGSHRIWQRDPKNPINENEIEVPPYYPDTKLVRRDIANGFEAMQLVDRQIGALLKRLDDEGLSDNTLVFFIGDNGRCLPRGKQFLYEPGLKVPIIIRWPGKVKPGTVSDNLASTLDICATILDAAGAKSAVPLHGKNLFNGEIEKREYLFGSRDKMDDTHDAMRTIIGKRYKLIHNLMPERPYCQYNWYKEASYPILAQMNVMNMKGELKPEQSAFMAATKPEFELFDLKTDPHEIKNLANDPKFSDIKKDLLNKLNDWRKSINDPAELPETFRKGGWSSVYPTRTQEQWEEILELWKPWVFRAPTVKGGHPRGAISKLRNKAVAPKAKKKGKRNKKK